jgi:hypothetical protein
LTIKTSLIIHVLETPLSSEPFATGGAVVPRAVKPRRRRIAVPLEGQLSDGDDITVECTGASKKSVDANLFQATSYFFECFIVREILKSNGPKGRTA